MGTAGAAAVNVMGVNHGGSGLSGGSPQSLGGAGHEVHALYHIDTLGLSHSVQSIVERLVTEVMHLEAVGVLTHPGGVVVKLYLGHIAAVYRQVSLGGDGSVSVGKAGALIPGRVVHTILVLVHQGDSGAHEERPHQGVDLLAVGIGKAFGGGGVLLHQSGDTRQVGRGHGGAAHHSVAAVIHSGVDVAARGGDVRLQGQGGGHAPGGEVAHLVSGLAGKGNHLSPGLQGQGRILFQSGQDVCAVNHGDGGAGDGNGAAGQIHEDDAGLVVVNQAGHSAGSLGVFALFRKGDDATLDKGNLTRYVHLFKVRRFTHAGNQHHFIGSACQGLDGGIDAVAAVHIGDVMYAAHADVVGHNAHVLHAGNGQGVGIGAGGAQHTVVGVGSQVGIEAEGVAVAGGGLVTGGDAQHRAGGPHPVEYHVYKVRAGGKAGRRAQAHVHHVALELQGVLQGCQPVLGIGAAALTEHLHDYQLGIGSHAYHAGAFHRVGGGNTGHMGAVVALQVVVMGDVQAVVHIVEAEGHLGAVVHILGSQPLIPLSGMEGREHLSKVAFVHAVAVQSLLGQSLEVLVVGIQAGIDDRNGHALAGVAPGPGLLTADHGAVGVGLGSQGAGVLGGAGLIHRLEYNLAHTLHGGDFAHLPIGNGGSHTVDQPAKPVGNLQGLALQSLLFNFCNHLILVGFDGIELSGGLLIVNRTAVGGDHAVPFHYDDNPHILLRGDVQGCIFLGEGILPDEGQAVFHTLQLLNHQLGAGLFRGSFRRFLSGDGGQSHGEDHAQSQQPCIYTLHFHYAPLLIRL